MKDNGGMTTQGVASGVLLVVILLGGFYFISNPIGESKTASDLTIHKFARGFEVKAITMIGLATKLESSSQLKKIPLRASVPMSREKVNGYYLPMKSKKPLGQMTPVNNQVIIY